MVLKKGWGRMSHQIFLGVVEAVGLDEDVDESFKLAVTGEGIGDVGARKFVEDLGAIALEAGVVAAPEGRVGREREQVGQEIAHRVHDADGGLAVLDADVHMQAEDEVGAGDGLQIFDDAAIALVGIDLLLAPVGEGVSGAGDEHQAMFMGEANHLAAEIEEVFARFFDGRADVGADLDD